MCARSGSYQQAGEFVLAVTRVSIGKRQLEQITAGAAADAERFCRDQDRSGEAMVLPGAGQDRGAELPPLAISADGKGVAMRPGARRRRAKAPDARTQTFEHRRGTGEKGHKRVAQTRRALAVPPPDQ